MAVCPKCKAELDNDSKFCDICGFELANAENSSEKSKLKKKSIKKWLIISGSALVSVFAVIIALILILPSSVPQYIFYIKDGDLFYADLSNNKKYELSDDLNCGYSYTAISNDGKRVFYLDKYSSVDGTYSLYYRDAKNTDKQPTKLDSGVSDSYFVNNTGDKVTYLKGESLYQHNLKDKTKISDNVVDFAVSPDGKRVVYIDERRNVYFSDVKTSYKAASDIENFVYLTDDYKTFYYLKENTLYKQTDGADNFRIAKDIVDVINIYDSGEMLYLKASETRLKCADYIYDNVAKTDEALQLPVAPDPNVSFSEYNQAYKKYKELQQNYLDKLDRDEIRHKMETETFSLSLYSLYSYDENGEKLVADNVNRYQIYKSDDFPVVIISMVDVAAIKKINITALENIEDLVSRIDSGYYDTEFYALANASSYMRLSKNPINNFALSEDGKYACYSDTQSYGSGNLFRVEIGQTIGEPKVYSSAVSGVGPKYDYAFDGSGDYFDMDYCFEPEFYSDGEICYAQNEDSKTKCFDLYIGEERIAERVSFVVKDTSKDKTLYFFDDYNADKKTASLKMYKDSETVIVDKEVYFDYSARMDSLKGLSDGGVLYLKDMRKSGKAEMIYFDGKDNIKIDDDVEVVLPQYDFEQIYKENRNLYVEISE